LRLRTLLGDLLQNRNPPPYNALMKGVFLFVLYAIGQFFCHRFISAC
jgi:hypothetical protein